MKSIFSVFTGLIAVIILNSSCTDPMLRDLPDGLFAFVEADSGNFVINLDYIRAPMTVANFVGLSEGSIPNSYKDQGEPFFDSLTFHRHVPGFVVQGGDPNANGTGGPGLQIPSGNFSRFDPSVCRSRCHGQFWSRYQWESMVCNPGSCTASGWRLQCVWTCD